jgi:hypothetical protein
MKKLDFNLFEGDNNEYDKDWREKLGFPSRDNLNYLPEPNHWDKPVSVVIVKREEELKNTVSRAKTRVFKEALTKIGEGDTTDNEIQKFGRLERARGGQGSELVIWRGKPLVHFGTVNYDKTLGRAEFKYKIF